MGPCQFPCLSSWTHLFCLLRTQHLIVALDLGCEMCSGKSCPSGITSKLSCWLCLQEATLCPARSAAWWVMGCERAPAACPGACSPLTSCPVRWSCRPTRCGGVTALLPTPGEWCWWQSCQAGSTACGAPGEAPAAALWEDVPSLLTLGALLTGCGSAEFTFACAMY